MKYMEGKSGDAPTVSRYAASMILIEPLLSEIERCIHSGRIQDQASKELIRIRKKMTVNEERMKRKLDSLVSKHRSIMQEHVISQRGGRTVLPIKKEFRKQVKGSVLDESGSGQTVYIEPVELVSLQMELAALQAEESREEMRILGNLTSLVESYNREIALNTETVVCWISCLPKPNMRPPWMGVPFESIHKAKSAFNVHVIRSWVLPWFPLILQSAEHTRRSLLLARIPVVKRSHSKHLVC